MYYNYILFKNIIYQQCIGIPQGRKTSSMLANLYLYYYECTTTCNNFIFYRYINDIVVFYLNNNTSLDLTVNFSDNLNFSENYFVSNAIAFLDLKIILNSSNSLDLYDKSGGSRGKIESAFRHFTKFNMRKTDLLQNST